MSYATLAGTAAVEGDGMRERLYVMAAAYDEVEDAQAAYGAIEGAWRHFSGTDDFDATVIAKDWSRKVEIVRRHSRRGTAPRAG